ncbi:uncharacterized protein LOC125500569 isoform X1 [Athalia rosae]|uniref:uncharacterized protein LOC125500569 isoform X1 n=1 Tax=Athalia rosae TaxID=37344 RepID=UPI00203330BE|nr:uncharacterized protein LOC125500569 isoform X1 [Athalia rosae]
MAFFDVSDVVTTLFPISSIYWFLGMGVFEYPPGKPKKLLGLSYAATILVVYVAYRVDLLYFQLETNLILTTTDVISSAVRQWAMSTFIGVVHLVFSLAYYKVTRDFICSTYSRIWKFQSEGFFFPRRISRAKRWEFVSANVVNFQKHNRCLMELNEIDSILKGMGVVRSYRPFLITQLWQCLSLLISMTYTVGIRSQYEFSRPSSRYRHLSAATLVSLNTYAPLIASVNEIRFYNFNQITEQIFKDLNMLLESLKMERPHESSDYSRSRYGSSRNEILFSLRKLYTRSSRLAKKWNQANAVFVLATFLYSLSMMSVLFLEMNGSIMRRGIWITRNAYSIVIVTTVVLMVVKLMITVHSAVALMSEAHRTCGILLEHLHPIRSLRSEVYEFSMQLIQNPLRLSVFGVYPMDYSLVHELISSLVTYVITVIQQTQGMTAHNATLRAR